MISVISLPVTRWSERQVLESNIVESKMISLSFSHIILTCLCRCGKLYCDAHTQYEIKLNRQAQHDPECGVWCKVCAACYVSRQGYLDCGGGATRNKTQLILQRRARTIDKVHLESNRLEKRLEKVFILLLLLFMAPINSYKSSWQKYIKIQMLQKSTTDDIHHLD
jgi:hypothetical protein